MKLVGDQLQIQWPKESPLLALQMLKAAQGVIEAEGVKAESQKIVAVPGAVLERLNGQPN